jgi:hypothetical protein
MTQPTTTEISTQEQQPTKEKAKNDFFADIQTEADLNAFVSHMQQDKEIVEAPEIDLEEEAEEQPSSEERELLGQVNGATPEHQELSKFILIQIDKVFSFAFSLVSGMEPERYQTKLSKSTGNEYESEILAGLLYKYQLRMSLEYMFLIAILLVYTPMATKAVKDRKEVAQAKKLEEEKQRAQIYREIITPTQSGSKRKRYPHQITAKGFIGLAQPLNPWYAARRANNHHHRPQRDRKKYLLQEGPGQAKRKGPGRYLQRGSQDLEEIQGSPHR